MRLRHVISSFQVPDRRRDPQDARVASGGKLVAHDRLAEESFGRRFDGKARSEILEAGIRVLAGFEPGEPGLHADARREDPRPGIACRRRGLGEFFFVQSIHVNEQVDPVKQRAAKSFAVPLDGAGMAAA